MKTLTKVLVVILVLVVAVGVGLFGLFHWASQPTPPGKRINSDTDLMMWVDLPGATPSRAISLTTDEDPQDPGYEAKIQDKKDQALGRVEGDIPPVKLAEDPRIVLHFQDLYYNNISPDEIKRVEADLRDVLADQDRGVSKEVDYQLKEGALVIDPGQFDYERHTDPGEIWYELVLTVVYTYQGQDYTSVTALLVFDQ
ncbi:MAG: hypothetical protein Q4E37_04250 [Tissierellia bacterium]|nr:hypothetical protein [Tissierellia bacterium]